MNIKNYLQLRSYVVEAFEESSFKTERLYEKND